MRGRAGQRAGPSIRDTFEYEIIGPPGFSATGMYSITKESMDPTNDRGQERDGLIGLFDENGVARFGASQNLFHLWDESADDNGDDNGDGDGQGDGDDNVDGQGDGHDGHDGHDGSIGYDGSDGYIAVIETNGDGTFTGKTYKVPGWLILEHMQLQLDDSII